MCWMAAIPVALAGAQAISGQNAQAKMIASQTAAGRRQAMEIMKQTNIQNADLSLQARSRLEEASSELTSQNMQKVQAMGSIRAVIGESMLEGASMDRIKRVTEGQFIQYTGELFGDDFEVQTRAIVKPETNEYIRAYGNSADAILRRHGYTRNTDCLEGVLLS